MHQVAAQLLKNEPAHTISGPWWLIQLWLNLYIHKIVRPDLRNLNFSSSNFDEEYRGEERRTRQCMSYGEAISAITIVVDFGHLFKKFYRGFDVDSRVSGVRGLESKFGRGPGPLDRSGMG